MSAKTKTTTPLPYRPLGPRCIHCGVAQEMVRGGGQWETRCPFNHNDPHVWEKLND
jgi:hypothetical protein